MAIRSPTFVRISTSLRAARSWPLRKEEEMASLATISNTTGRSKTSSEVLGGWLRVWARLYRRDLTEEEVAIYGELLADVPPEQLDAACRAASKKCTFFPTPAEIRAQMDRVDAK